MFDNDFENKWCPGCGNFGILEAMKKALAELDLPPERACLISGIGQAGKTSHFLNCNGFHGLHGRALPVATGALLANHELKIIVNTGDGDCLGEGGNHFLHAVRRNVNLTVLLHNNKVFGLTQGQASPTSDLGMPTKAQPGGTLAQGLNPVGLALTLGAGFVARGFSGKPDHLAGLIKAAVEHKGLAFIDILQPCPSFNKLNTYQWYSDRIYDLQDSGHPTDDLTAAWTASREWGERIPIGMFHLSQGPSYTDKVPCLKAGPLVDRSYSPEPLRTLLRNI